jgi:hypothetical protein
MILILVVWLPMITVVIGAAGVGKTQWIRQQLRAVLPNALYFCPEAAIDGTQIAAEFPEVTVCQNGQEAQMVQALLQGNRPTYIEVAAYLDLQSIEQSLEAFSYRRVAIVSPNSSPDSSTSEWQNWADEQVIGTATLAESTAQLWRAALTGLVFDPASLETVWHEINAGAYGQVQRAKGIFEMADGRSFSFDFVAGLESIYSELALPRWLEGRPDRFSGIEVVGEELKKDLMGETLQQCLLSDAAIAHYQEQIKQSLGEAITA